MFTRKTGCSSISTLRRAGLNSKRLATTWNGRQQALEKELVTPSQVDANRFELQRSELALREAEGMKHRLENFARLRIIRELEAKIESVKSDLYAQQSAFQIEKDRLNRLEINIEHCTLKAPRDGILVYSNESNGWGRVETMIQEGTTVREGQAIFQVPDPTHMLVKATINESKISKVFAGQHAWIRADAFPDEALSGTVQEVTPIPSQGGNPFSDIKIYNAVVGIDSGALEGLRPGMSAEVSFFVEAHQDITRVPRQAIRKEGEASFVAIPTRTRIGFRWQPLQLGLIGSAFAEVVAGLEPGDRVIADPWDLPAPPISIRQESEVRTAAATINDPPTR